LCVGCGEGAEGIQSVEVEGGCRVWVCECISENLFEHLQVS